MFFTVTLSCLFMLWTGFSADWLFAMWLAVIGLCPQLNLWPCLSFSSSFKESFFIICLFRYFFSIYLSFWYSYVIPYLNVTVLYSRKIHHCWWPSVLQLLPQWFRWREKREQVLLEIFTCMSTVSYLQWVFLAHLFTHRMLPLYKSIKRSHPYSTTPLKWTSKSGKSDELWMPLDSFFVSEFCICLWYLTIYCSVSRVGRLANSLGHYTTEARRSKEVS